MADKFGQFFKDTLKKFCRTCKRIKNQSEIDKFYENMKGWFFRLYLRND